MTHDPASIMAQAMNEITDSSLVSTHNLATDMMAALTKAGFVIVPRPDKAGSASGMQAGDLVLGYEGTPANVKWLNEFAKQAL